jgi:hypothetical protein
VVVIQWVTRGEGVRFHFRARDAKSMAAVISSRKQESKVLLSSTHPTELAYLQELLKRLQDRHVDCVGNQTDSDFALHQGDPQGQIQ